MLRFVEHSCSVSVVLVSSATRFDIQPIPEFFTKLDPLVWVVGTVWR